MLVIKIVAAEIVAMKLLFRLFNDFKDFTTSTSGGISDLDPTNSPLTFFSVSFSQSRKAE